MADENQEQNEDEDSVTSKDMLSFSWQIAQGMVSKKLITTTWSNFLDGVEPQGTKACDCSYLHPEGIPI